MSSKILSEPELVGRDKELAQLELCFKYATEGKGTTILVSGEAGAGKTRLINTFIKKVRNKDIIVLSGWCLAETKAPYFPFIEAFNYYYAHERKKEQSLTPKQTKVKSGIAINLKKPDKESETSRKMIGSNFLEKIFQSDFFSPQIWKDQVFAAVTNKLELMASKKPLILFIEDLHWADSASIALFHYISRSVKNAEKILLLGTFRSEDLTADSEGHPHQLAEVMRMMRREDLYNEIKLSNLNQVDVARIAEDMIGGTLHPKLMKKLAVESKGNPLYIVESLRMLHERQNLNLENNQWSLAVGELGLPSKIKDIILRRLAVLKYSQRRVLDAASVIGEKFDVEVLSAVLGMDYLEVLETLNIIAQTTHLVSVEENYYKFDHERSRVTLYNELALPLKQGYHAKIAEKLETAKANTLPLSDLTNHYGKAGNKEKAIKYSLAAAKDELAKFSNQQAIQHFKYVLQNTKKSHKEERSIALEGLGDAYLGNSMYAEAIKTFNELAVSNSGLVHLRALRKATDAAFHKWDEPDLLLEYAKRAEKLASFDRLEMGRILNNRGRAFSAAQRGDITQDLADYNAALKIFEEENSLADVADALWRSGIVTSVFNTKEGLNRILRSAAIFRELDDVRREAEATLSAGQVFYGTGLFSEAKRKYLLVLSKCEKLGMFSELRWASEGLSSIYEHEKNLEEALTYSLKSIEYGKKTDARAIPAYNSLVRIYSKLGDVKNAEKVFKSMMKNEKVFSEIANTMGTEALSLFYPSKAVYLAAKDQLEEASKIFENHIKLFKTYSFVGNEERVREDYAWFLEKTGKMEKAQNQREKINILLKKVNAIWKHANVFLSVMAPSKVLIGEKFDIRLDLVNVGNSTAVLTKIEGLASPEIKINCPQSFCNIRNSELEINSKKVDSFKVVTIKLKAQAAKQVTFNLNPEITYLNDLDEVKKIKARKVTIKAEKAKPTYKILPGRITTGSTKFDELLMGGIPKEYAVVLTGSPCDERQSLIQNYLYAGIKDDDVVFYVSTEADDLENMLENPDFVLFLCNNRPKTEVPDHPNVYKLRSKTDLTNLSISLAKAYRNIDKSKKKRICVETVSNVLLDYEAKATCKWISELITDLGSKGFTILAVMDPEMHPPDQSKAVINLFDGEISITQSDDPLDCKKSITVKKLRNQDYIKNPICLT